MKKIKVKVEDVVVETKDPLDAIFVESHPKKKEQENTEVKGEKPLSFTKAERRTERLIHLIKTGLIVFSVGVLSWSSWFVFVKGITMALFGIFIGGMIISYIFVDAYMSRQK